MGTGLWTGLGRAPLGGIWLLALVAGDGTETGARESRERQTRPDKRRQRPAMQRSERVLYQTGRPALDWNRAPPVQSTRAGPAVPAAATTKTMQLLSSLTWPAIARTEMYTN
jgi:hypothetical protein